MNTQQYVVPLNSWSGQGVYFVKIYDASNNWQTYNLTVNGNGNNVRTFNLPQGWNSPASTGTINQSLISPAGPFAVALIWDGTSWFSAI